MGRRTSARRAWKTLCCARPRAPAGLPDDPDAKEINFTQQLKHPLRISTEETEKLLAAHNRGEADQYVFLDVRENAEQSMGSLRARPSSAFPT